MTLAILLTDPGLPPSLAVGGVPLAAHLADQLRQSGVRDVVVATDLARVSGLARTAGEPVLLCAPDVVAHTAVLRHVVTSPGGRTVALVLPDPPATAGTRPGPAAVREERGQILAGGAAVDPTGPPSGTFGGVLRVNVDDLPALAAAAQAANRAGAAAYPLDRLVTEFVRGGATIFAHRVRLLVARRVADQREASSAEAAVAAVDSDAAELKLSVKEKDDFFATYFVSTWSPHVTRLAARAGLGPTAVTLISVLFALAAAALFGFGAGRPAWVFGAILLYLGFVLDCVDGQLARYTRRFSAWGGWLDTMADRAKEYLVYAGLAIGVERSGLGNGWALATAAIVLQTVRHMTDTWYGALHDEAARRPRPAEPARGGAGGTAPGGLGDRLSRASNRVQADVGSPSYWLKRTVVFPIGERWALIALTVALFNPLVSLVTVLTWAGIAAGYTLLLRTMRARTMRVPVFATVDTALHRDDGYLAALLGRAGRRLPRLRPLPLALLAALAGVGLLGAALVGAGGRDLRWATLAALLVALTAGLASRRPHTGSLDWLVPAALRTAEYLFVVAIGVGTHVPPPATYALLFVLALRHYDLTARLEQRKPSVRRLRLLGLGWDGRLAVLTVGVLAGVAGDVVVGLAAYLLLVFVVSALAGRSAVASTRRSRGGEMDATPALATAGGAAEEQDA